ncbi:MAG: signal peptidase I [Candidatus Terrybacteria bacterium]|nr:signal peptidase I [Candidatus Terrybacteria bacterium]
MEQESKEKNSLWEFIKFTVIAILIVVPIRLWIAQPFIVSGASMEPTFDNGDYLIIDELSYNLRKPQKGEVVVFRYPLDPSKFFIKRIAGLPEETMEINGRKITLAENEYFVLGDNRSASSDSRIWGPVPENLIVGRTLVRLWPITKLELMPGSTN